MRTILSFLAILAAAAGALPGRAVAGPIAPDRLLVVELFSSQACAACPAANAVVAGLAQRDETLLLLDLHVTYFDRAGWKDRYSIPAASRRQQRYSAQLGTAGVYTPQVVVGGRQEAQGYDAAAVHAAVARARAAQAGPAAVGVALSRDGGGLRLSAGAGAGRGTLWLVGFDPPSGRGGAGVNTVRSLSAAGDWHGEALTVAAAQPLGERTALLLQDGDGAILAAAVLR